MKLAPFAPLLALTASLAGQVGRGETGLQLVSGGVTYGVTCSAAFSCTYVPASLVRGVSGHTVPADRPRAAPAPQCDHAAATITFAQLLTSG